MYFLISHGPPVIERENPYDTAPTLQLLDNRVRFGTGVNTIVLASSQKLATPPVLEHFTYASENAAGNWWHYSYTRSNVTAPEDGEQAGYSEANSLTVTSPAVNQAGLTQSTITGQYQLYGWHGTLDFAFADPYELITAMSSLQRQALVDPGTVTAVSNGTDTPDWALCNSAGTVQSAPTATHIKLTDPELMNASGTLDLQLTST